MTTTAILLAKAAITQAAVSELQRLADELVATGSVQGAEIAFSEQGQPALRDVLCSLADSLCDEVLVLPLIVPSEPGFAVWLTKSVQRWRSAQPQRAWPTVRVAPPLPSHVKFLALLQEQLASAQAAAAVAPIAHVAGEGSTVPAQQCRVLVCHGAPCNNAGAAVVWGHLRNEQKRLDLRTTGRGVMTAKTSCLGPCNLAPVIQVFPDGTYYGGVNEAGVDQIIASHLLQGVVVDNLAYAPGPGKQRLRG